MNLKYIHSYNGGYSAEVIERRDANEQFCSSSINEPWDETVMTHRALGRHLEESRTRGDSSFSGL